MAFNVLQYQHPKINNEQHSVHRPNKKRETPTPIYVALIVHAETRKKDLVDKMHQMGLTHHLCNVSC